MNHSVDLLRLAVAGPDHRSDAQMLEDFVHRRDAAAIEAIVRRHGPMVWGVCRRALAHHDAEDAFQATFLVLTRRSDTVRPPGLLGNWLYGVARRTARKARSRAAQRQLREATMDPFPDPPACEPSEWTDLRPLLDRELERLPDKYRAPVVLCDLEGKTRQEAARRLGWPEGTVCSRLSVGRKKLAARLARRGLALSGGVLTVTLVEQSAGRIPQNLVASTVQFLTNATGPRTAATVLAERVVKAMAMSKVKLAALVLVAAGLVGSGALLVPASGESPPSKPGISVTAEKESTLVLKGHTDSVFGVAFSPDGLRVATASFDQTVKIWSAETAKELVALKGHTLPVLSVVFEPNGHAVITAASKFYGQRDHEAGEVIRWDAGTGEKLQSFTGHDLPTYAVAVSPDGTRVVAVGGTDSKGELTMWEVRTAKVLYKVRIDVVWPLMAVDFNPDGKLLAVGGGKEVRVLDVASGKKLFESAQHPDPVYATVFSPDGMRVASAGIGKPPGIRLWDAMRGKKLPMIETTQRSIRNLAFSRDGILIAAAGLDGTARVYDVATGTELLKLTFDHNVNAVALDREATRLAVACEDKMARIYVLKKGDDTTAAAPVKPDPKPKAAAEAPDARQTAEAFLDAAVAGKVEEARLHADMGSISVNKVRDFERARFKRVDISVALAGDTEALIISEPIEMEKEGKGHVLLGLRKKDGRWRVRDIDFEPSEKALHKQRDFLESHSEARAVRAKK
jgi:RNA polymerase sigma factor (sigma-70 family)